MAAGAPRPRECCLWNLNKKPGAKQQSAHVERHPNNPPGWGVRNTGGGVRGPRPTANRDPSLQQMGTPLYNKMGPRPTTNRILKFSITSTFTSTFTIFYFQHKNPRVHFYDAYSGPKAHIFMFFLCASPKHLRLFYVMARRLYHGRDSPCPRLVLTATNL